MEALALRLSQLDSHAEGALQVVTFHNTLLRQAALDEPTRPATPPRHGLEGKVLKTPMG